MYNAYSQAAKLAKFSYNKIGQNVFWDYLLVGSAARSAHRHRRILFPRTASFERTNATYRIGRCAEKRCKVRTSSFANTHLNVPKCAHDLYFQTENMYFQTENIYFQTKNTYFQSENRDYVRISLCLSAYLRTFKYAFPDDCLRIVSDKGSASGMDLFLNNHYDQHSWP